MTTRPHFAAGLVEEAAELVRLFHYSHRVPSNIQFVGTWHEPGGLFGDLGNAIAACFLSIPPTRWNEDVLELSRLVRRPDANISLSGLISDTLRYAKRLKGADLIVSFADRTHAHHGGIYQASGWQYAGLRPVAEDGLLIDGVFWPGRTLNSRFGTRSATKLLERFADRGVRPHLDEGKHIYWRALGPRGSKKAEKLGLGSMPYPKPNA